MPILRLFKLGRSVVVTIPKGIREELKVFCGDSLAVDVRDGVLRLTPMETRTVAPAPDTHTSQNLRRAVRRGDE